VNRDEYGGWCFEGRSKDATISRCMRRTRSNETIGSKASGGQGERRSKQSTSSRTGSKGRQKGILGCSSLLNRLKRGVCLHQPTFSQKKHVEDRARHIERNKMRRKVKRRARVNRPRNNRYNNSNISICIKLIGPKTNNRNKSPRLDWKC
jgi:hypothetical protein